MTAEQLQNFLGDRGIDLFAMSILDGHYRFPSKAWILGTFADGFLKVRAQFELPAWEADIADCDDFADLAAFYASFLNRVEFSIERRKAKDLSEEPPSPAGLAFGTFFYVDRAIGAHAINVAIVNEVGGPEFLFFEPQSGKQVDLSQEEIWSCQEIRL